MDDDEIISENENNFYSNRFIVYLHVILTSFVVFLYTIYLLLPRPQKEKEEQKHAKSD